MPQVAPPGAESAAQDERSKTRPRAVRPPGGLWFTPEAIAANEAMRAKSLAEAPPSAITLEEFCKRHFPEVFAKWLQDGSSAAAKRAA
jgi:hypothetical protein